MPLLQETDGRQGWGNQRRESKIFLFFLWESRTNGSADPSSSFPSPFLLSFPALDLPCLFLLVSLHPTHLSVLRYPLPSQHSHLNSSSASFLLNSKTIPLWKVELSELTALNSFHGRVRVGRTQSFDFVVEDKRQRGGQEEVEVEAIEEE